MFCFYCILTPKIFNHNFLEKKKILKNSQTLRNLKPVFYKMVAIYNILCIYLDSVRDLQHFEVVTPLVPFKRIEDLWPVTFDFSTTKTETKTKTLTMRHKDYNIALKYLCFSSTICKRKSNEMRWKNTQHSI